MKKLTFLFILCIFQYNLALTQGCLPEGIIFTSQEQLDSFQVNYPGCTEIEGNVGFGSMSGSNINNLNGLSVLTSIGGSLCFGWQVGTFYGGTGLTNLSGLDNLTSIGGMLIIRHHYVLTSLTGLNGLDSIGGSIWIYHNTALTNLTGMENLTFIGGELDIYYNDTLMSLAGLNNLTSVGGNLTIARNPLLSSLSALENITYVGGELNIDENEILTSLAGLENITSIGGNLKILDNDALTNLSALNNLISIGGFLEINSNDELPGLMGLENIETNSIDSLFITNNNSLATCEVQSICEYLAAATGAIIIHNNAPGCNSQEEVDSLCNIVSVQELNVKNEFSIFPNPCSCTVNLRFVIYEQGIVICDLFEISGVKIKQLLNEPKTPGTYEMEVDLSSLKPGIYFCILKANPASRNFGRQTKKIIKL